MSMRRRTLLKVIVLGDSGVGKTSLMNQILTVRIDMFIRSLVSNIKLQLVLILSLKNSRLTTGSSLYKWVFWFNSMIWDTAGQERFQSLGVAFYRGADCCVLVYDVNVMKSFDSLENWHEEFLKQSLACIYICFIFYRFLLMDKAYSSSLICSLYYL
ncbi:hypothetical protein Ahy_A05g021788 isoform A [Arachis hypogaea]|uniref:Ras-related protein n=1 Tax=Arachis hypogaea TaxID=3818 RepID=A0A445CYH1_ARAHY|nr:hypothetical protein Ahy_A05g021788 isoform A [Arachis hypogaea]